MFWFLILVVLVVLVSLGRMALLVDDWGRDLTTNVASLQPAHVDPELRPQLLSCSVTAAVTRVEQWVAAQSAWRVVEIAPKDAAGDPQADGVTIRLTRTTGLMRYVDDIEVTLCPDSGQTQLSATSRSRLGKGDLGQNPRSLKELVRGIQDPE